MKVQGKHWYNINILKQHLYNFKMTLEVYFLQLKYFLLTKVTEESLWAHPHRTVLKFRHIWLRIHAYDAVFPITFEWQTFAAAVPETGPYGYTAHAHCISPFFLLSPW